MNKVGSSVAADKLWTVSTTELMLSFRDGLLALIPIAERVHIPWKEPSNYDDWDAIASVLFDAIVIGAIANLSREDKFLPFVSYDHRVNSYQSKSFITGRGLGESHAFICFETRLTPFDTCLFARLNQTGLVVDQAYIAVDNLQFAVVAREGDHISVLDEFTVVL